MVKSKYRTRYKLRKETDIEREPRKLGILGNVSPVTVNSERNQLKGKKGNARRQNNIREQIERLATLDRSDAENIPN